MTDEPSYSVIIPVYGNEASIPELMEKLAGVSHQLPGPSEVIFVVDGSPDNSYEVLAVQLAGAPFKPNYCSIPETPIPSLRSVPA